jgi:hypothetical protein
MSALQWGRILVFGLLAGVLWTLLSTAVLSFLGNDFVAALPTRTHGVQLFLLGANEAAGVWAMWLYASIRLQYGPGLKSAAIAGVGWWIIQTMQSSKWVALSPVPLSMTWAPGLGTLPAMIVAITAGAWGYENYRGVGHLKGNRTP